MSAATRLGLGLYTYATRIPPRRSHTHFHPIITPPSTSFITREIFARKEAVTSAAAPSNAKEFSRRSGSELCIFTDGSRRYRGGGVGGAARANTPEGTTIIMKEYLGKAEEHRAVDGEILGAILALRMLKAAALPSITHATILMDSKLAIRKLLSENKKAKDGALVKRFDEELRGMQMAAHLRHLRGVRLAWVPGHKGVLMNELVDLDAKAAALGESSIVLISKGL